MAEQATTTTAPDGAGGQGTTTAPTPDGGGQRAGEPIRDMAELQRVIAQRDDFKAKFDGLQKQFDDLKKNADADALAKNKAEGNTTAIVDQLQKQLDDAKTLLADATGKLTEAGRRDRRRVIADAVLQAADPAHRDVLGHALVGIAEAGEINFDAEDAKAEGAKALATLTKRYPQMFAKANGSSPGVSPSGASASLPADISWAALTDEQRARMSDDDFSKLFGRDRAKAQQRRGIW